VLFPLERYKLAKAKGDEKLAKGHDIFFGNQATQIEATPALAIERGEQVFLPPALVFRAPRINGPRSSSPSALRPTIARPAARSISCC
jgi:hypothetical protein